MWPGRSPWSQPRLHSWRWVERSGPRGASECPPQPPDRGRPASGRLRGKAPLFPARRLEMTAHLTSQPDQVEDMNLARPVARDDRMPIRRDGKGAERGAALEASQFGAAIQIPEAHRTVV